MRHEFQTPFHADQVDRANAIIRGVSIVTSDVTARGHELDVDATTLAQMLSCAQAKGQIPVKANHKSGVEAVTGFITNFFISGTKLKGDWHILQSHPAKEQILETAERMPGGVGLSAAFISPEKAVVVGGRKKARCEDLLSVDYVTMPAANPDGLFQAVDTNPQAKMDTPSLQDLLAQVKALTERVEAQDKTIAEMTQAMNPPSLEDLANMDEAQLAELGLTTQEVEAALQEAIAGIESEGSEAGTEGADAGAGDLAAVGAGVGGAGGADSGSADGATGFQARLEKVVLHFEQKIKDDAAAAAKAAQDKQATLFASIEKKVEMLTAENSALKKAFEAGTKPLTAVVELTSGSTDFNRLIELQVKEGKSHGAAVRHVIQKNPDAYRTYLQAKGVASK